MGDGVEVIEKLCRLIQEMAQMIADQEARDKMLEALNEALGEKQMTKG